MKDEINDGVLLWKRSAGSESPVPEWTQARPGVREEITMTEKPSQALGFSPREKKATFFKDQTPSFLATSLYAAAF